MDRGLQGGGWGAAADAGRRAGAGAGVRADAAPSVAGESGG